MVAKVDAHLPVIFARIFDLDSKAYTFSICGRIVGGLNVLIKVFDLIEIHRFVFRHSGYSCSRTLKFRQGFIITSDRICDI